MQDSAASVLVNWLAANNEAPRLQTIEVPLYCDAWITGSIEGGKPYELINLVPTRAANAAPVLLLRADIHYEESAGSVTKTDKTRWTGARSLADELAAVLTLDLGGRFAAGTPTRFFDPGGDPMGRPSSDQNPKIPAQWTLRSGSPPSQPLIPSARGPIALDPSTLERIRETPGSALAALIRAARAYREALWICEDEPALAWLLFVSAVEAAAEQWHKGAPISPGQGLRDFAPEAFVSALDELGPDVVTHVAPHIVTFFGAARKFTTFMATFLPAPPAVRSQPPFTQVDWSASAMKKAIARIYSHRSAALHSATPFPAPMTFPPMRFAGSVPSERPFGGGAHGGHWVEQDCPMNLHVFEYIVRHSIKRWWSSIAGASPTSEPTE